VISGAPIFEVEAFTRQLHDSQWRWYSHDPATLRAADAYYRDFRHVKAGQALVLVLVLVLVLEIYEAFASSPNWEDTVLVVVYDEHGGFYDNVAPPPVNDHSGHKTLGVRVPALVIGPRVGRQVCHETPEHTSLIKTILQRFASNPQHAIRAMPGRVQQAPHLGMLGEAGPRTDR
jgi:hypothetical protein